MLKRLWVNNFKALNNFQISLSPFTVIVGINAAGKSSVLQVLEFLAKCVEEDFEIINERRGQQVGDIKSKLSKNDEIQFRCQLEVELQSKPKSFEWELEIMVNEKKNSMILSREKIIDLETGKALLTYDADMGGALKENEVISVPKLSYKFSLLKLIDAQKDKKSFPEIAAIKSFWEGVESFEMLSPGRMRAGSRGKADSIGKEGERLPSFIKSMQMEQREKFSKKIEKLLGKKIKEVRARTKGRPGWTYVEALEQYGGEEIEIPGADLSDGMLRLLAFLAVSEMGSNYTMFLLDEIENGINTNYAEELLTILKQAMQEKKQQMIVTTHSTVFVDYVPAEDICYLYREEETGEVRAASLFELPGFKKRLEQFYPGEILLNLSNEEILKEIMRQG